MEAAEKKARTKPPSPKIAQILSKISRQKYIDPLSSPGQITQEERVRQVGTTEIPQRDPEAPYDFESATGIADFLSSFTGIESGLVATAKSLEYNRQRQKSISEAIQRDYGVSEDEASEIMDRSELNITDIFSGAEAADVDTSERGAGVALGATDPVTGATTGAEKTGEAGGAGGTVTGGTFGSDALDELAKKLASGGPAAKSALEAIKLQIDQQKQIEELTAPFREDGLGGLSELEALAFGEETGYTPSELYKRELETGLTGITKQQVAGDRLKSSGTFGRRADLASGLSEEDIARYEKGQLGLLQTGLRGEEGLRAAGQTLSGSVSGTLGTLGQHLNEAQRRQAQEAITKGQTLQSGISGLTNLARQIWG
ncbi:MAG: hypothetical protein GY800_09050 [Planctomycetes bacterium]|nr:hypothetical protein [Planctomycetota bacterium]